MKDDQAWTKPRGYPHMITKGIRRNHRWPMVVSNDSTEGRRADDAHVFVGAGFVAENGDVTPAARRAILRRMRDKARSSRARHCIVWSPTSCTWLDQDGGTREGNDPPEGAISDPWANADQPAKVEWCWTIELPKKAEWSHLCVRTVEPGMVEIAPGEPMTLADFNEPEVPGRPDPAAGLLDAHGRLAAPRTYRGQPVTGIRDDWKLLGPVQPEDQGVILRNPWPEDVAAACDRIAGMDLPKRLHDAAWRAIHPEYPDVVYVGVLKAA